MRRTMHAALLAGLALQALTASAQAEGKAPGDTGFATKSVTGLGLTGEPNRNGTDNGAGSAVGAGANAGVVGGGGLGSPVGAGTGPGTPQPGGGTFGSPARR